MLLRSPSPFRRWGCDLTKVVHGAAEGQHAEQPFRSITPNLSKDMAKGMYANPNTRGLSVSNALGSSVRTCTRGAPRPRTSETAAALALRA
ncbi:hypothetical protein EVAR_37600_1 [Eumeta japonica]|uniref:Uncharacterized protein n=1 Tax=Eumeta variegata TaxID=151549 RepID=A0A4C1VPV2_EUMVA|nr:hypothetical protein EVAR_37600_1 [Eumeta japonica]